MVNLKNEVNEVVVTRFITNDGMEFSNKVDAKTHAARLLLKDLVVDRGSEFGNLGDLLADSILQHRYYIELLLEDLRHATLDVHS